MRQEVLSHKGQIMLTYIRLIIPALLLSMGIGGVAKAASFDCNKATTETEIAICGNPSQSLPFLIESYGLIKENLSKITKLPLECISYEFEQSANSQVDWSLRETHNPQCGGDPNTSPRSAFLRTSIKQNNDDVSLYVYDTPCGCWETLSQ
jgi:hypothetical protein